MEEIKYRNGSIGKLLEKFKIKAFRYDTFKESIEKLTTISKEGLLALDTETTSLTFWKDDNYILGYSLAISDVEGYYFNSRLWNEEQHIRFINELNNLTNDKTFWNLYFDYGYSKSHYGIGLESNIDGMLWFHTLFTNRSLENIKGTEKNKGFSLKEITAEFTEYGEYEYELKVVKKLILTELNKYINLKEEFTFESFNDFVSKLNLSYSNEQEMYNVMLLMNKYIIKGLSIKEKEFCYGFFPDNILDIYAIFDVLATWNLTTRCIKYADSMFKDGWEKVYDVINIKHKASLLYSDASIRGFKVDRDYVQKLSDEWKPLREISYAIINQMPEITQVESLLFREELIKNQRILKPYNIEDFSLNKFKDYFRVELIKANSKRKSNLPLSKCRVIYNLCNIKWNAKKDKAKKSSKLPLSKCRKIYNNIEFNLNSPAHKYKLFIEVLNLEPLEYNKPDKSGNKSPKLNNEFVEHYARLGYDFMDKIHTYSLYQKGISSFLGTDDSSENGLWNVTTDEHPYNHSSFHITGTISSRLATSNLNLSQFPSRGVLHESKNCFIVEDGYKLFTFDYATSELRILGALAKERNFIDAFESGVDLHSKTAYSIWNHKMEIDENLPEVDKLKIVKNKYGDSYRYFAKSINFSLPYGTTEFGLSKSIGVTKTEAKGYIEDYRNANPSIANYIDWSKDHVMSKGYTEGSYGERLYLKNAKGYNWRKDRNWKTKNWKAISEYKKATNFIIQSDNAFMLYYSLVNFFEDVKLKKLDISLIATIYDSLYIRVNKNIDNKYVYDLLKEHFEVDFYGIPMKIDVGISLNKDKTYSERWGNLTDVKYEELDEITKINLDK